MPAMNRRAILLGAAASGLAASAAAQGVEQRFTAASLYSVQRGGAAFLVARHGVVLFENYPPGAARDTRWPIGRGTRVFAALLAASLIDDRLMTLDEAAASTLGEWAAHPVKRNISIRVLLNGTSGVAFGPRDAQDAATAVALEPLREPGLAYSDDAAAFVLFAEIARRKLLASGRTPDPALYLDARTLAPIGCGPVQWSRGPDGAAHFDDGAAVSARSLAQVGELIRRDGVWRAQQLIDVTAVAEAQRGSFAEPRVGFGLYLAASGARQGAAPGVNSDVWRMNGLPSDLVMAAGEGGQRLYIAPSRNLVAARLSRGPTARDWSDAQFLSLVLRDA
jgi:Beta-lactamase